MARPGPQERDTCRDLVVPAIEASGWQPEQVTEQFPVAAQRVVTLGRYARQLDAPLAYATNGVDIIEHNLRTGLELRVTEFAAPAAAWDEYVQMLDLDAAGSSLLQQPLNRGRRDAAGDLITPRYYQSVAITRVLAAIARGQHRALLLMATGTGKTFTAMQIVAKLRAYEAAVRPQRNYRVLYLSDRDQLLSQPMRKDFIPAFGAG